MSPLLMIGVGGAIAGAALSSMVWGTVVGGKNDSIAGLEHSLESKQVEIDVARADADRWQKKASDNDAIIQMRNREIREAEADAAHAEKILNEAVAIAEAERTALNEKIRKLKEKARAQPNQILPLGDLSLDYICHELRTPAGGLPAGCPAAN